MKNILLIILLFSCFACAKEGKEIIPTDNHQFQVTYLFTVDNCKVYRFSDNGTYRYLSVRQGSSVNWIESCGKNCERQQEIKTE